MSNENLRNIFTSQEAGLALIAIGGIVMLIVLFPNLLFLTGYEFRHPLLALLWLICSPAVGVTSALLVSIGRAIYKSSNHSVL